jgi:hypothetical protein
MDAAPEAGSALRRDREQALLTKPRYLVRAVGSGPHDLLPIDAVQLVEPAFGQQCLLEHEVAAAIRYTEAQATS